MTTQKIQGHPLLVPCPLVQMQHAFPYLNGHILVPTPPGIQASPFCCRGLLNRIDEVVRLAGIPPATVTRLTEPGTTAKE